MTVFIASPMDVMNERNRVRKIINDFNDGEAKQLEIFVEAVGWETHSAPDVGGQRPEGVILEQMPLEDCDVFVGILGLRFGSPTGALDPVTQLPYVSGTEEEFRKAYFIRIENEKKGEKWPKIMFYRNTKLPDDRRKLDLKQYAKVEAFFEQFGPEGQNQGLYQDYESLDQFDELFRRQFRKYLHEFARKPPPPPPLKIDWTRITPGTVKVGIYPHTISIDVPEFFISRFPITQNQFAEFTKRGYEDNTFWSPDGLQWRNEKGLKTVNLRHDDEDQPQVGVNWYEAVAFTKWLSSVKFTPPNLNISENGEIRLLKELEWERAIAERRVYTSDLWEWCHDIYHRDYSKVRLEVDDPYSSSVGNWQAAPSRSIRGANLFNEVQRDGRFPHTGDNAIGFRVVWTLNQK